LSYFKQTSFFFQKILEKHSNVKCNKNQSSGSRAIPCGRTDRQTDTAKLIVAFRNFAKTHRKRTRRGVESRGSTTIYIRCDQNATASFLNIESLRYNQCSLSHYDINHCSLHTTGTERHREQHVMFLVSKVILILIL